MPKKRIFTIGFYAPGEDFEYLSYDSDQSLLDADIILYEVGFGHYATDDYQGTPLFDHSDSARVARNIQHWRSELAAATNAGKLVIVFLASPRPYFRHTGDRQFSGTGRSRITTNIVAPISSYDAVPNITSVEAKSGREVRLTKEGIYLAPYWSEFHEYSPYESFIKGKFSHTVLATKAGDKIVAAAVRSAGWLLFVPPLRYDEDAFREFDQEAEKRVWTKAGIIFGKRLSKILVALSETLRKDSQTTPAPPWTLDTVFTTPEEETLHSKIAQVSEKIAKLQSQRTEIEQRLQEAGSIRALLYEQGKPLERAVRDALLILGFSAVPFAEGDSEFDVIFESLEGRCLGEVEGKDSKAINIDKFSQLERNLQEDFAREGITEYAKGCCLEMPNVLSHPVIGANHSPQNVSQQQSGCTLHLLERPIFSNA
jgi:hypothetical protein